MKYLSFFVICLFKSGVKMVGFRMGFALSCTYVPINLKEC